MQTGSIARGPCSIRRCSGCAPHPSPAHAARASSTVYILSVNTCFSFLERNAQSDFVRVCGAHLAQGVCSG